MGTKSTINLKTNEGRIKSIYCHWDGYPDNQLPILTEHYDTYEKVDALMELGDLSSLDKSIECPEGHSFKTPVDGYCVAYGRDRGEENTSYSLHISKLDIYKEEFNYLFKDGEWRLF